MRLSDYNKAETAALTETLRGEYARLQSLGLKLDMSRGKPGDEQLNLSRGLINCLAEDEYMAGDIDCRNYGGLDGLPEMKQIFAELLGLKPEQVVVGGNSSLTLMFDSVAVNMTHGAGGGAPWVNQGKVKFLCPVPGYDRHFSICEYFHIKMLPIKMTDTGPDMDEVERLVSEDEMIKGIWCVPKYSNPCGTVYSEQTVRRMANLKPKAGDFRIYWDNAYAIHHLYGDIAYIPNILEECEKAGNPHMAYVFASFSKVSFSGAAVSCVCSSVRNAEHIKERIKFQTIGPDKINQLRHVKFFGSALGVLKQMDKHADILRPKFELIYNTFEKELAPLDICSWSRPRGGYFISFNAACGTAKKIVSLCADCGLTLTPAGAAYPYGNDITDSNIRIAPSYPSLSELEAALEIFCVCVKLAAAEKQIEANKWT